MTQGAGGGRRSRIVIDVARAQGEAQKKKDGGLGRVRRYLSLTALILIGVLLVLLVSGYAWWRSFEKSPAYSLALLVDAAQRDDRAGRRVSDRLRPDSAGLHPAGRGKARGAGLDAHAAGARAAKHRDAATHPARARDDARPDSERH